MLKFIQNNREITALLAVVLLFVLPGFLDRQYLSVQTLTMVYSSAQILILLAMGATLVMLTRNIDVSVGSITGMCAVLLGMLLNAGYSLPVACVATLLLGLLAGFFNGVLVAWLKIPAIVATLGTLGLYRGIMLLWTGGKWIEGLPAELKQLSAPLLFGVSAIGWLTIILVAFIAWLLAKTAFGRSFYATGDNLQGARQLGVRTEAIRIVAFSLNGCMAALAGIVFASQIGFIPNQTGTGLEMKAIAACVLGGINFANLDVLGLPVPLIIFLICLLVFWLWLHKTHAGRNVFLIGQSPRVALYSAIPVNRTLCALYAMTGLASAVAAVLLVSYFGSARSDLGASFLMPAITAVVLGGANIYGGSGSIIGTAIAVLLVGYLQQGLQMAGVPNQVSSALSGALLIVVVVGRSVSLHRQQIKEWLARRANNPLP